MDSLFSWLQFDFMKLAFMAILIIAPLFGLMGTMIVTRKMAFFSDALGHSALTGIAIGVVLGTKNLTISMVVFALFFGFLMSKISSKNIASTDTVISVCSSCSIAIGLVVLSKGGNFSKYSSLLVGDILSITFQEIFYLLLLFVGTLIVWCVCSNWLLALSIHRTLARSRRIPVKFMESLFTVLVSLIVALSIQWVGILLINALLILPAASSRNISENFREYHFFSILFSVFSGVMGLVISYYVNVATGPTIVIIASIIYAATYLYGRKIQ